MSMRISSILQRVQAMPSPTCCWIASRHLRSGSNRSLVAPTLARISQTQVRHVLIFINFLSLWCNVIKGNNIHLISTRCNPTPAYSGSEACIRNRWASSCSRVKGCPEQHAGRHRLLLWDVGCAQPYHRSSNSLMASCSLLSSPQPVLLPQRLHLG